MNREQLAAAVPVHQRYGRPYLVVVASIPEPWRTQFARDLRGSAAPLEESLGQCAYAWDWLAWVEGRWVGRYPVGLDESSPD